MSFFQIFALTTGGGGNVIGGWGGKLSGGNVHGGNVLHAWKVRYGRMGYTISSLCQR